MHSTAKQQFNVILLIVLLGFIGNSIAYPIFAPLFLHPLHGAIVPDGWSLQVRGMLLGATLMMYPLGQFFGSPILGALSDQFGRKHLLVASSFVMTFFYLLTALALSFNQLWLLIVSRFLTGCAEGNLSIARSMVVDLKELNQHKSFGMISAMTAVGYIIGPLIGGVMSDHTIHAWFSYALPFYIATAFSIIITVLTAIYLHESLATKRSQAFNLLKELNIVARLRVICVNKQLKFLLITSLIAALSYDTFYEFFPAYMTGLWHATAANIAYFNVVLSTVIGFGCGWLSPLVGRYVSRERAVLFALPVIAMVELAMQFQPQQVAVMVLFVIIGVAISISTTNFTLQVSHSAEKHMQGEVLGTMWGLRMLLDGVVSIICGFLLMVSYSLPLLLAGCAAILAWVIFYKKIATTKHDLAVAEVG